MEERLQKVIARAGLASRREAERLIEAGRISVNGRVVRELGVKVDPGLDEVALDTVPIPREAAEGTGRRTYLLLQKPKGVVCTVRDPHARQTVLDLVPPHRGKRLYPVGRLDEETEGIVILTNDGDLTDRLTHPRYGVPKVYEVRLKGRFTQELARTFESGVWLSDGKTGRSRVRVRKAGPRVSHVSVTLTEGRNREIRRAFAKLGHAVLSLRRTQIGPVVSRGLKVGQYRPLTDEEVDALRAVSEGRGSSRPLRGRRPRKGRRPGKPDPAKAPAAKSRRKPGPRKGPGR